MPNDVSEIQQAKAWIYTVLAANSDIAAACGTRIYNKHVPGNPASRVYPYIVFDHLGGNDVNGLGTNRLLSNPLFQVRVVTQGNPTATTRKIDKRIDDVIGHAVHQLSGDYYFTGRREQSVDRDETDTATGLVYWNLGGLFRLDVGRVP